MNKKTFYLETYGCQMNEYDSHMLETLLTSVGLVQTTEPGAADLVIVNTCSVRERAEERALGRIAGLGSHPGAPEIAVIGCMAQRLGAGLLAHNPRVKYVLGTDQFQRLAELLQGGNGKPVVDIACREAPEDSQVAASSRGVSAYVTIMRGCNNFCSYCIVPYVRGRESCRPPEMILAEIHQLERRGVREVWLLGQNVNSYRYQALDFPMLLRYLLERTTVPRLRFLTSHPKDLSPKLIENMAGEPRVCKGLHLPLQSGADAVLARMNRRYTAAAYRERIARLRESVPSVVLTTDIIVGFPGETAADYAATRTLMETIQFDAAFMFRYSVREGTAAERLSDDVPEAVKLERLADLIEFQKRISERKMAGWIGARLPILLEEPARRDPRDARGKTDGGLNVIVRGGGGRIGEIVSARIVESTYTTLVGEMAEE